MDDDNTDELTQPVEGVDQQMIYDIQEIVSRLVSKAPYIIGKDMYMYIMANVTKYSSINAVRR